MAESERRQFVKFNFFKVAPEWRFLSEQERTDGKRELSAVVDECSTHMFIRSFSMVGIRGDADFLLWQACDTLEELQDMMTSVYKTQMGRYLQQPYSYLAMTRRSQYVGEHQHEGQEGTGVRIRPGEAKYFVVYPFLKTREWYVLPSEERQRMMMTHINTGHKYPSVKINTTYSFGLDDQEFVVAFETDSPSDFVDLVMDLRATETSLYTLRDVPIFTAIRRSFDDTLDSLGG
jgi:chlorite dismutase